MGTFDFYFTSLEVVQNDNGIWKVKIDSDPLSQGLISSRFFFKKYQKTKFQWIEFSSPPSESDDSSILKSLSESDSIGKKFIIRKIGNKNLKNIEKQKIQLEFGTCGPIEEVSEALKSEIDKAKKSSVYCLWDIRGNLWDPPLTSREKFWFKKEEDLTEENDEVHGKNDLYAQELFVAKCKGKKLNLYFCISKKPKIVINKVVFYVEPCFQIDPKLQGYLSEVFYLSNNEYHEEAVSLDKVCFDSITIELQKSPDWISKLKPGDELCVYNLSPDLLEIKDKKPPANDPESSTKKTGAKGDKSQKKHPYLRDGKIVKELSIKKGAKIERIQNIPQYLMDNPKGKIPVLAVLKKDKSSNFVFADFLFFFLILIILLYFVISNLGGDPDQSNDKDHKKKSSWFSKYF